MIVCSLKFGPILMKRCANPAEGAVSASVHTNY